MQYRKLPRGTEQISVLGIGTSSIQASNEKEIEKDKFAKYILEMLQTMIDDIIKKINEEKAQ